MNGMAMTSFRTRTACAVVAVTLALTISEIVASGMERGAAEMRLAATVGTGTTAKVAQFRPGVVRLDSILVKGSSKRSHASGHMHVVVEHAS